MTKMFTSPMGSLIDPSTSGLISSVQTGNPLKMVTAPFKGISDLTSGSSSSNPSSNSPSNTIASASTIANSGKSPFVPDQDALQKAAKIQMPNNSMGASYG